MPDPNARFIYRANMLAKANAAQTVEEAWEIYNELVLFDPLIKKERGVWLLTHGKTAEALRDFAELVVEHPVIGLPVRAKYFLNNGMNEEALSDYNLYVKLRENDIAAAPFQVAGAYKVRAEYHERVGSLELAESDWEAATQFSDGWLRHLALFCQRNNLVTKFENCLDRLVKQKPTLYLGFRAAQYESELCLSQALDDYNSWVNCTRVIGWSLGYSPKAWALKKRALFFKRQHRHREYIRDSVLAALVTALQRVFGFSGWPADHL